MPAEQKKFLRLKKKKVIKANIRRLLVNIINILQGIKEGHHTHEIRTGCCGRESIRDPGNEK